MPVVRQRVRSVSRSGCAGSGPGCRSIRRGGKPDERSEEAPAIFWVLKSVPLFPSGPLLELVGLPEFAAVSYF